MTAAPHQHPSEGWEPSALERLIQHAVVAGGLRKHARENPPTARGLIKCANRHSEYVAEFASAVLREGPGQP